MSNTKNTTVIIPIHEITETSMDFTKRAIASLNSQKDKFFNIMLVVSSSATPTSPNLYKEMVETIDKSFNLHLLYNHGETDYQSQINYAVQNVETEYFTILQYDDVLFDNFMLNVNQHITAYDYDVYLGIVFEKDDKGNFLGFSNEVVWSLGHMEKFGHFDLKNAKTHNFHMYSLTGATIRKSAFLQVGGFKKSMVKFHDYEFLLRMLNVGKTFYVIPKFIYEHINGREGSIFSQTKDMPITETKFWYDAAKKEYHFDYDREIAFA
jgi:GT2 family glycosyltransferase